MKVCTYCKEEKPLDSFGNRNKGKNQKHSRCKTCMSAISKERWKNNTNGARDKGRAASRNYNYRSRYNAPEQVVQQLIKDPNGLCEICKKPSKLFVDHCHSTEQYRGLLCRACNLMLGYAKDNMETLMAGASYLKAKA